MKNYLVTIETYYSVEEFLIPMDTEKSEVMQIDTALTDICFCDDYAIAKWEENYHLLIDRVPGIINRKWQDVGLEVLAVEKIKLNICL